MVNDDSEEGLTVAGLVVLVGLHGLVGSGTTDQLVGELGLVLLRLLGVLLVVVVVLSLLRIVCWREMTVSTDARLCRIDRGSCIGLHCNALAKLKTYRGTNPW
jgi:hypothetical protein